MIRSKLMTSLTLGVVLHNGTHSNAQDCGFGDFSTPYTTYSVGYEPIVIEIADLDRDGDLDIVVPNSTDGDISILLNNGDGTFAPQIRIPAGGSPTDLVIADFNGDQKPDLAVSDEETRSAKILLNSGSLEYDFVMSIDMGSNATGITAEDFDGDGDMDLAVSTRGADENLVILTNVFVGVLWDSRSVPVPYSVRYLRSGDIDNDGYPDILASYYFSGSGCQFAAVLNQGDGTFTTPTCETLGSWSASGIALADIDGDQDLDIVYGHPIDDDLVTLRHRFDGDYVNQQVVYAGGDPVAVAIGDIDLDGDPDAVVANESIAGANVLHNYTGSFGSRSPLSAGGDNQSIALGDLDNDGDLDMIVGADGQPFIRVLQNMCDPVPCPADLTNDGDLNFFDASRFLSLFSAADPAADFTGDGALNFFDVSAFLNAFSAGCP